MSSGGGLFDRRFAPFWRGPPVIAVGGFGERALPIRAGVSSALTGGGPSLNVADSELERGGASGDGLIVDEKGTYMADAGRPVGVHVRSERSEAEPESEDPYESSEGGEAGVTVAESHALWRILADLFAVIGVLRGAAESNGFGDG